jgi:hypothetical protein
MWANPILTGELKAVIINFYAGNEPSVDVDNMSKPILDALQKLGQRSPDQASRDKPFKDWRGILDCGGIQDPCDSTPSRFAVRICAD